MARVTKRDKYQGQARGKDERKKVSFHPGAFLAGKGGIIHTYTHIHKERRRESQSHTF